MKRALQAGVCLFLFALCAFSQAASLGRLTVLSSLGQPLRAEVELLDVSDEEAANLAVALAPVEAYRRSGLDYSSLLQTLDITVVQEGERRFARIRSAQPVSEPYIGLLLELAAGQARKGREYALTLDAAERTSLRSAPLSSAASLERLSRQQRVERLFTRTIPADAARPAAVLGSQESQKTQEKPGASRYVVARGDTLSKIAARLGRRDISLEQMLVALYRNNPDAFLDNNMNLLKEGASLSIPEVDDGEDISRSEARSVVRLHAANFSDYSQKLAGMVRKSSPRSTPATGPVAEGRISTQVKEQPTPASRLPDRLELSKVRPGEQPSGMTVEEKVAITQAVEENRHRIVELEKNVGELKNLLEIVSESGAAIAQPAQTPADMKAGGQKKAPPATDKTAKGKDAVPVSDGRKDTPATDAENEDAAEKAGVDPDQTLATAGKKVAAVEELETVDDEDDGDEASDDEDENDDEDEEEESGDEASGRKRQGRFGLNNRLVWLVAAGVTALLLALIAGLAVMRRKKAAVRVKASMREETALREEPEEALNPNIISGREFLENLPAPDLDEDEAGSEASDSVEGGNEADEAAAEAVAGEFEEVEFPQVEEALQDESEEALGVGQETEPEAADVPSSGEEAGEDEPFVSLDQASVENEVSSKEAEETVQAALTPDSMALPEALTEEAVLPEEGREAFGAEALADVGKVTEDETDKTSPDALEEVAAEEVDNTEKARALELDLSDIDLSAGAEDGGVDIAGLQADTDAGTAEAEMAAKLELAMAYLDMKDKDGARELLEEVMEKGTPRQAEEAAQAMQSL
ncbi:MAG: hypothetical protein NC211_06325 [Alistipes senegalensis]|nr:hypothetical protein [Oxalobacter formigenes]MCM1281426.1 hypothetical protein [Alistipes senegalensis]